jgi:hypothetical protein
MHSISTSTALGSCLTATQLRAGLCVIHFSYSVFISPNKDMSARKMLTLTTLSIDVPAASSTCFKFVRHCAVFSAMVPSTSEPSGREGI